MILKNRTHQVKNQGRDWKWKMEMNKVRMVNEIWEGK